MKWHVEGWLGDRFLHIHVLIQIVLPEIVVGLFHQHFVKEQQWEEVGNSHQGIETVCHVPYDGETDHAASENGDDIDNHKRVIDFLLRNNLIRKTQSGRYYNESFKYDSQTRAKEYGANFEGKIKLAEFIDLYTGEWIHE